MVISDIINSAGYALITVMHVCQCAAYYLTYASGKVSSPCLPTFSSGVVIGSGAYTLAFVGSSNHESSSW